VCNALAGSDTAQYMEQAAHRSSLWMCHRNKHSEHVGRHGVGESSLHRVETIRASYAKAQKLQRVHTRKVAQGARERESLFH
jgi:hypothetical protein